MDITTLTQEQKDQMLMRFMQREAAKERIAEYKTHGLTWSKNGYVTLRQGKHGDKQLPSLYIHPTFLNQLAQALPLLQQFVTDQDAKSIIE